LYWCKHHKPSIAAYYSLRLKLILRNAFTDEATVVEAYGLKISLIEGEENNIKITRPIDLLIAEKITGGKC
jgi:2-C-methyl-D-erythritol 4-phosphate cytidylyltransferase